MLSDQQIQKIYDIFEVYNETLKPLLAEVDIYYKVHPLQLFNEIRAFTDHLAHVFLPDADNAFIDSHLNRAWSHINRSIFDCLKFINVHFFEELKKFEHRFKNVNFAAIKDGEFYNEYRNRRKKIVRFTKEGKKEEGKDRIKSFDWHQQAYEELQTLDDYLNSHIPELIRAKVLFNTKRVVKFILWIIAAIISGMVSLIIACPDVYEWLKTYITT